MDKITYHIAGPQDIETLVEYRLIFAQELAGVMPPEQVNILRNQMTDYFERATAARNCLSVVALCGEAVAGIGTVQFREQPGNFKNPSGRWGYVMNMYTVKRFRKRGICTDILEILIEEGKKYGITAFELHATPSGEPVYQKSGFIMHQEPTYRKYMEDLK